MIAPASCPHPEEAREPLEYDGHNAADPDDWRCLDCGATNLRLDRRSYADRLRAAEDERLADAEFERFEERHRPRYETRTLRTKEGDVVVATPLPPMDFRNESVADILDKIFQVSGVAPVLGQTIDTIDVSTFSMEEAINVSRERWIKGGFDPARPDSDLTSLIYAMPAAGSLLLKRVDHVEFAHDLFARTVRLPGSHSSYGYLANGMNTLVGMPIELRDLGDFAFRIVGS